VRDSEEFRLFVNPLHDRHDLYENLPFWKGTIVAVDIGIRRIRSFEQTMAAIRAALTPELGPGKKPKVRFV
jgi:hypothetical protein